MFNSGVIEGLPGYQYRRSHKDVNLDIEFQGERS